MEASSSSSSLLLSSLKLSDTTIYEPLIRALHIFAKQVFAISSGPVFMIQTRAQQKLLHTWVALVILKQNLVRMGQTEGPAVYLPYIPTSMNFPLSSAEKKTSTVLQTVAPTMAQDKSRIYHQQPEVNCLPRFSPQLISPAMYTLSVYIAGGIDLLENLDIVHITLLVVVVSPPERIY